MNKFLYSTLLVLFWFALSGQTQMGHVEIKGKIKVDGKNLSKVEVSIFEGNNKIKSVKSESNGKFIITLEFDKEYMLSFSKKDYVTKKVFFDTKVKEKQYVWPYPFTIELFKMVDGLDVTALDEPVTKIAYLEEEGDFGFDIPYTNRMKSKIAIIQNRIKSLEQNAYINKVNDADKKFRAKDYQSAIILYEQAIDINPFTDYPDDQIMLCESRLANQEYEQRDYDKAIASADSYFNTKEYDKSKKSYKEALSIYSDKQYPKDRLNEITSLLAIKKKEDQKNNYRNIIKKADALFARQEYQGAKSGYLAALKVIPEEAYPKTKISEIDGLFAQNQEAARNESRYKERIAEADRLFTKREYQISKNAYVSASKIKPKETYPLDRIKDIDMKMAFMKVSKAYSKNLRAADELYANRKLQEAKVKYQEASGIKPSESYPKERIKKIDQELSLLANQNKVNQDYDRFIKLADGALATQNYTESKANYNKALGLKSKEAYPKQKIIEIDQLLGQIASTQAKEKQYDRFIKEGDLGFNNKQYESAKLAYNEAIVLKPSEAYPKGKISEINSLIAQLEKANKQEELYSNRIRKGDNAFGRNQYELAKNEYQAALTIRTNESYPKERIKLIDSRLSQIAQEKSMSIEYEKLISEADNRLKAKDYDEAKSSFNKASFLRPTEEYPKKKIEEIDSALALMAANEVKEQDYQNKVKIANQAFQEKKYELAKTNYLAAINLNSQEVYPKQKVEEIDEIIAKLADFAKKEELYKQRIASADSEFSGEKYAAAKLAYQAASKIKTTEQYPKNRIAEINKIEQALASDNQKSKQYTELIAKADKALSKKDYLVAKDMYTSSLELKPQESYPKTKRQEIDDILKRLKADKALSDEYNKYMVNAEKQFEDKDYQLSKSNYKLALKVKPNETYPKNRISEIDNILKNLADQANAEKAFNDKIAQADQAFSKKEYSESKKLYSESLRLNSKASYPKKRINEIDKILLALDREKAKEGQYLAVIKTADSHLSSKDYQNAKLSYESALKIKPLANYPQEKLTEISTALSLLAKKEDDKKALLSKYQNKVDEGDRLLAKFEYQIAKNAFEEASAIKPSETYPKSKIAEINSQLASMAKDTEYASALKKGSDFIAVKKYNEAKQAFMNASDIKPNESFPKQKITEIDKVLANLQKSKKLEEYKAIMAQAETKFDSKAYAESKVLYQSASKVNPRAQYPKDRIKEIEQLLVMASNKEQALELKKQKYSTFIQRGDKAFTSHDFANARSNYKRALNLSPQELYPKEKISEIDKLQAADKAIPEQIDFANAEEKNKFMSTMAAKYGEGVHEESYESKSGKVVRRIIVVESGVAKEYREVKQPWGATYFFKNGKSISRAIFFSETKK